MTIQSLGMTLPTSNISPPPAEQAAQSLQAVSASRESEPSELRQAFDQFVGETFYGQMLKAMRSTVGKPAYFHGGRGEEVFQQQLDQLLTEKLTEETASQFTGPMFELFQLGRAA